MLGVLRKAWAPEAFIVSFKLETDEGLLITKVPTQIPTSAGPRRPCTMWGDVYK